MTVKWRDIPIDFLGGVDTKTDDRYVKGKLLRLENGQFPHPGRVEKRPDVLPLGTSVISSTPRNFDGERQPGINALATVGDELIAIADQTQAATTDDTNGPAILSREQEAAGWATIGNLQPVSINVERVGIADNASTDVASSFFNADYAYGSNHHCIVHANASYGGTNNAIAHVVDTESGSRPVLDHNVGALLAATGAAKVVHVDGVFVIYGRTASAQLSPALIDTTTLHTPGTFSAATVTNMHSDGLWDYAPLSATAGVLVYGSTVPDIKVYSVSSAGALTLLATIANRPRGALMVAKCVDGTTDRIAVAYQDFTSGNIIYYILTTAGGAVSGPVTLSTTLTAETINSITGIEEPSASATSSARFFYTRALSEGDEEADSVRTRRGTFAGAAAGSEATITGVRLCGKAFQHNDRAYVTCVHADQPQITLFLKSMRTVNSVADANTDAKLLYEAAYPLFSFHLSNVVSTSTSVYSHVAFKQDRLLADGALLVGPAIVTYDMAPPPLQTAVLGSALYIGGGTIQQVDGRAQELGFHRYPASLSRTATGAGSIGAGDYSYVAVLEWVDHRGQVHRSSPSPAITVTQGASSSATVRSSADTEVDYWKSNQARVHFYRTAVGPGATYYKCDANVQNTKSGSTASITDSEADATLTDNEELYTGSLTNGVWDVPENIAPPASDICVAGKNRLWVVPSEDRTLIWFSRTKAAGLGVEFSDLLTKRVEAGGNITALGFMDEKVIVFKDSEIRYFVGEGPNNVGQGAFSEDYLATSDVGCTERNSVVVVPDGLMFKSLKGIYLLGRDMSVRYVGADVEAYNGQAVNRALLLPKYHQVRFVLDGGPVLVYDYFMSAWSVYTDEGPYAGAIDGAVWQDEFTLASRGAALGIYKETPDNWNAATSLLLETGWISTSGIQGFQRARELTILGRLGSPHTLHVSVFYDYDETAVQTRTFDSAAVDDGLYQWSYRLPRQKCEAVKFRIWDSDASGTNEGFSINQAVLTVGVKTGPYKLLPTTKAV